MKNNSLCKLLGISLLELLLAFTIITVLLTMVLRYYAPVKLPQQINEATKIVQSIIAAAEDWKATYGNYGNADKLAPHCITKIDDLAAMGFTTNISNPWNGTINVTSSTASGSSCTATANQIIMTFTNIPATDCSRLSLQLQGIPQMCKGTCDGTNNTYKAYYPC